MQFPSRILPEIAELVDECPPLGQIEAGYDARMVFRRNDNLG
jgi:hypothetical protein